VTASRPQHLQRHRRRHTLLFPPALANYHVDAHAVGTTDKSKVAGVCGFFVARLRHLAAKKIRTPPSFLAHMRIFVFRLYFA
jgi:hypothetical protein